MSANQPQGPGDPDDKLVSGFQFAAGVCLAGLALVCVPVAFGALSASLAVLAYFCFRGAYRRSSPENAAKLKAAADKRDAETRAFSEKYHAEATAREEARKKEAAQRESARKETEREKELQQRFLDEITAKAGHEPVVTAVLGRGLPGLKTGSVAVLTCRTNSLHISTVVSRFDFPIEFASLTKVEITGSGKNVSDAGFIGGGFGLENAVEGILIASVLNAITTQVKNETYLAVRFDNEELMLHIAKLSPLDLRVLLSPAIVAADTNAARSQPSLSTEIERLARQVADGILTEEEFTAAKATLLRRT